MDEMYKRIWEDETITLKEVYQIEKDSLCYVALYHASRREISDAQRTINSIKEKQEEHSCSVILEANALIKLFSREYNAATIFALDALKKTPEPLFSYWVLAQIELEKRKYTNAVQYFEKLLNFSPKSENSMLNVVEALALGKDYKTAQKYLEKVKPSMRKTLYGLFISFFQHKIFPILWIVMIFFLIAVNAYLFVVLYLLVSILLIYLIIHWGYKKGDRFIFGSSVFIQAIDSVFFFIILCSILDEFVF